VTKSTISSRKLDHIQLAFESQLSDVDSRFYYEPMLSPHPVTLDVPPLTLAGVEMKAPIWISSMTGGAALAGKINLLLAEVCKAYGLGMGLGSCRPVLENSEYSKDFEIRKHMGDQPLFANLGIAQIEELIEQGQLQKMVDMVNRLEANGLIVHVNPLQEWMQPEGDRFVKSPLETIQRVLDFVNFPVIVKEVGQGFGPKSLEALLKLPLEALDYGAFGGTNFSKLENLRRDSLERSLLEPVQHVGHTAVEMTNWVNQISARLGQAVNCKRVIVSGGIMNFLDGYYHLQKLQVPSLYAQASPFLKYALEGETALHQFVEAQVKGLALAHTYLTLKENA
jgi:isopentenyl-diphosphate Delta-isomerase